MQDPEQEPQHWDEPILANSPEEARQECSKRAERYGMELKSIKQPGTIRRGRPQTYRCEFKEKDS